MTRSRTLVRFAVAVLLLVGCGDYRWSAQEAAERSCEAWLRDDRDAMVEIAEGARADGVPYREFEEALFVECGLDVGGQRG